LALRSALSTQPLSLDFFLSPFWAFLVLGELNIFFFKSPKTNLASDPPATHHGVTGGGKWRPLTLFAFEVVGTSTSACTRVWLIGFQVVPGGVRRRIEGSPTPDLPSSKSLLAMKFCLLFVPQLLDYFIAFWGVTQKNAMKRVGKVMSKACHKNIEGVLGLGFLGRSATIFLFAGRFCANKHPHPAHAFWKLTTEGPQEIESHPRKHTGSTKTRKTRGFSAARKAAQKRKERRRKGMGAGRKSDERRGDWVPKEKGAKGNRKKSDSSYLRIKSANASLNEG
jgi:hypothetical protein